MIIFMILTLLGTTLCILSPCYLSFDKENAVVLAIIGILLLTFGILIQFSIRQGNSLPDYKAYELMKENYRIVMEDSTSLQFKEKVYDNLDNFNNKLSESNKLSGNAWVGYYYPSSLVEMKPFNISKIK